MKRIVCAALIVIWLGPAACAQRSHGEYPVPGRKAGTSSFSREEDAEHRASRQYPAWFRGTGADDKADELSRYFFTELVGPQKLSGHGAPGLQAKGLRMGTLMLRPGATYPAHNHPASELYFVLDGQADWFVDDEEQHVTPGSIVLHRPYAVHGWTNTSKETPLRVIWVQWVDTDENSGLLDSGARLVNPEIAQDETTAKPYAVPLPPTRP